jgi:tRNA-2-methylthio-N6-dimethylallyladenosine synthase
VGATEEATVEGPSRKDPTVTTGRTEHNKLVHFRSGQVLRPGTYVDVRVTRAAPHHLTGELLGVTAPARHRTRIPVASA